MVSSLRFLRVVTLWYSVAGDIESQASARSKESMLNTESESGEMAAYAKSYDTKWELINDMVQGKTSKKRLLLPSIYLDLSGRT